LPIRLQLIDDRSMKFALRQPIFKWWQSAKNI
jgi:hypothetical protein